MASRDLHCSFVIVQHTPNSESRCRRKCEVKSSSSSNNIHNIPDSSHHLSLLCPGGRFSAGQVDPRHNDSTLAGLRVIVPRVSSELLELIRRGAADYPSRKETLENLGGIAGLDKHGLGSGMIGR